MIPIQAVTLVTSGGTPAQLCDQRGAPWPTTGFGALVYNTGPHLIDAFLENSVLGGGIKLLPGDFNNPSLQFTLSGSRTPGFFSDGAGNISLVGTDGTEPSRALLASFDWPGNLTIPQFARANGAIPAHDDSTLLATTAWVNQAIINNPAAGTVTSVSVVTSNGLAGTVANPTSTPAITLSTTVNGMLKGDGTAISAAVAGTDYLTPAQLPTSLPPSGAAGGDLTGSYPNPTINPSVLAPYALDTDLAGYLLLTGGTLTGQLNSVMTLTSVSLPAINIQQTWNNAATLFNGIYFNVTDTASNASSNLLNLQVGAANRMFVNKAGTVSSVGHLLAGATMVIGFSARSYISSPADGQFRLTNNAQTDFTRLMLGGTTTAFPAIKKNTGPALNFRDATDVSDIDVTFKTQTYPNNTTLGATTAFVTAGLAAVSATIPSTLPPSGTAGGDLAGTYPNPTIKPGTNTQILTTVGGVAVWAAAPIGNVGTVTTVSVTSANGLAGTVATATSTPAITLSTTITGMLKGDGTAISAGVAGTDYVSPGGLTTALGSYLPLTGGTLAGPGNLTMAALTATTATTSGNITSTGGNILASGGAIYVDRTGDAASGGMQVRVDAGFSGNYDFRTGALLRWQLIKTATAEGGANAGSNFVITGYDDAGTSLGNYLTITRSTGAVTLTGALAGTTGTFSGNITSTGGQITAQGGRVVVDRTGDAVAAEVYLQADAGFIAGLNYMTGAATRWILRKNSTAEGGSNVGSDFEISPRDDAGGALSVALQITRSTSHVALPVSAAVGSTAAPPTTTATTKLWMPADISFTTINRALMGNLYYDGAWKYIAAGSGSAIRMAGSGTDSFTILSAATGTAGGAASPVAVLTLNPTAFQITTLWPLWVTSTTAIPAGGTLGSGLLFSSTANFGLIYGSGLPNKAMARGSWYMRSDATASTAVYVNVDGTTGGWQVIAGGGGGVAEAPIDGNQYGRQNAGWTVIAGGGGGTPGTVTTVSVVSANGLSGTVATPTTTAAITLGTTISGMLKGNGTAISAAVAGTDYVTPAGLPASLPPSGTASGDLAGTYPSPTIKASVALTGTPLSTTPAVGATGFEITTAAWVLAKGYTTSTGTVTGVSVVSTNGFAGTATATATPAITLSTTITGMLKGNGTAISAGVAGTDYMTPANVSAAYQPLDAELTALAGLSATAGLVEQTAAAAFTKRLMGVTNATDVLTRADGDGRYLTPGTAATTYLPLTGGTITGATALTISGVGQTTANFVPGGVLGGTLTVHDTGSAVGTGGAILFSDSFGKFASIKGYAESGTGPLGDLVVSLRKAGADTFFTESVRFQSDGTTTFVGSITVATENVPSIGTAAGRFNTAHIHTGNFYTALNVRSTTAIPAGGTLGTGLGFSSTANFGIIYGSGLPNKAAARGSLYLRSDGEPYYNTDGTAAGWSSVLLSIVPISDTAPATPTTGQLWWSSASTPEGGTLYVRFNDGNTTQWVPATPIPAPPVVPPPVTISDIAPASPTDGQLWWNSSNVTGGGTLYVRFNDGDTTQWAPATPIPAATPVISSLSVVTANGLAGTVATPTTTPAITLSTTITGVLKGNGTAISAAVAGTDYMTPANVSGAYLPIASPAFTGTLTGPTITTTSSITATGGNILASGGGLYSDRSGDAAAALVAIRADPGFSSALYLSSTTGVNRWIMQKSAVAEGGSNAGSDLIITGYNDAGTSLGNYLTVTRANGTVTLTGALTGGSTGTFSGKVTSNAGTGGLTAGCAAVASNQTSIFLYQPGMPLDQKTWEFLSAGTTGTFTFRTINDAYSNSAQVFSVTRGASHAVGTMTITPPLILVGSLTGTTAILSGPGQIGGNPSTSTGLSSSLLIKTDNVTAGVGGMLMFGLTSGAFAAIKGVGVSGTANTAGDIAFSTRRGTSDTTLTETARVTFDGRFSVGVSSGTERVSIRGADDVTATNIVGFYANNQSAGIGIGYNAVRSIGSTVSQYLYLDGKGTGGVAIGYGATGPMLSNVDFILQTMETNPSTPLDIKSAYPQIGGSYVAAFRQANSAGMATYTTMLLSHYVSGQMGIDIHTQAGTTNNVLFLNKFGKCAIGDTASGISSPLQVSTPTGADNYITMMGNRNFLVGIQTTAQFIIFDATASAYRITIDATGNCKNTTGTWSTVSDINVKKDVRPYTRGLDAIRCLSPIMFRHNGRGGTLDDGRIYQGLSATDVATVIPEVTSDVDLPLEREDAEKVKDGTATMGTFKALDPGQLIYALINSVKELSARIEQLEAR